MDYRIFIGPPSQFTFEESLHAQPKSLAIVNQEFDGGTLTVGENKPGAGHGLLLQFALTQSDNPIDAVPEVDVLYGQKESLLWR